MLHNFRSAVTGRFVSAKEAALHPETTVREKVLRRFTAAYKGFVHPKPPKKKGKK